MAGVLAARSVSKSHGPVAVLGGVSLTVQPGARVGVVGPNGAGKTTLLRILAGLEEPESGTVTRTPPGLRVGYLPQEPDARAGETLLEYLRRRAGAEAHEHDFEARARTASAELGFDAVLLDRPLTQVSGGQAARARLAAILLARFDVFLLDEPTNDLDFDGLARLERFLARLRAGVVVVSHDRAFLERTVDRVVELFSEYGEPRFREFAGGFAAYEAARTRQRVRHEADYETFAGERGRIREQYRRMRAWEEQGYGQGRKKKRQKDVAKAFDRKLAQLDPVEKPWEQWRLGLTIAPEARAGDVVARLDGAVVRRGSFELGPLDLAVRWRERVAIVGPNGAGKTTLLAALVGELPLAAGSRRAGPGVVFGRLRQDRGEFSGAARLLDEFRDASGLHEEPARTLLAKFGLGADDVLRPGASLSPGERSRASLAVLQARGVNCLVLDEPTNHLDLPAIEELEAALEGYEGTVLLVTHDRRLLERFEATQTVEL